MMASIWSTLLDISPLDWTGVLSACLAGGIIGLERQLQGKPAGIRTSMLICLGSYLFVAVSNGLVNGAGDPSRVVGQVITGIGFIGAGVIMNKEGILHGVTSASVIWVLAGIGVTIGLHDHGLGIKLAVLTVIILVGIDGFERRLKSLRKGVHVHSVPQNTDIRDDEQQS
ncbi:MgtC/SapB family protein [Pokkaliibacter plantistimulans]|nr:MgtC/SapB family protein [Pokkaliibacter plantistimulans]